MASVATAPSAYVLKINPKQTMITTVKAINIFLALLAGSNTSSVFVLGNFLEK